VVTQQTRGHGRWLRMLVGNAAAAAVVMVVYSGVGLETPWRVAAESFGVAFAFACCIGFPASYVMPRLGAWGVCRLRPTVYWIVMIAALLAIGIAGSVAAISLLIAIGYVPLHRFGQWFAGSLKISIVITLVFGIFVTAFETVRARLDAATVALRTKERDEAEARRVAAEAQLASLESRVNPHFLFNTLNSIATLVHDNPAAAERMTTQLASLLRSSLDTSAPLVPIDEELAIVRAYLDIERVRFGERLRSAIESDGVSDRARVPRLAVQTLVENSIKYAVSPRREGGTVTVRAHGAPGGVRIDVADDGPGFDPAAVSNGHGLELVRARLAMAFGDRASLRVASRPGSTTVTIEIGGA